MLGLRWFGRLGRASAALRLPVRPTLGGLLSTSTSLHASPSARGAMPGSGIHTPNVLRAPLVALEIRPDGTVEHREWEKNSLAKELSVTPRDLRTIDSTFRLQMPVIFPDRVLLFDPLHPDAQELLPVLLDRCQHTNGPAFEFRALEGVFDGLLTLMTRQLQTLAPAVRNALDLLQTSTSERSLERLLPLKNSVSVFRKSISEIHNAFSQVINDDENMAEMYITVKNETGHRIRVDQHEEMEYLLERYMTEVEEIAGELASVNTTIKHTEDIVEINLDAKRNRIMQINLMLNTTTMALASGGLVASVFGMNLLSRLESHPGAFLYVSGGIALSSGIIIGSALAYFKSRRVL